MSIAECYASLARLLDYPGEKEGIREAHENVRGFLKERGIACSLDSFGRFVADSALARLQEEYVANFDFSPAVALYLGHHLHGDNQRKGEYLIRLKQEFRRHGFTPAGNELPDHLPVVLGFLAHLARNGEDGARRSFLSEFVLPGVERLRAGVSGRKETPWKEAVDAAGLLCMADTDIREEVKPC